MTIWRLIYKEMKLRKLSFLLALVSVIGAVAVLTGQFTILEVYNLQTEAELAEMDIRTKKQMFELEDEIRKITVQLGFNLLILPKDQNLSDFYLAGYAAETMPEEYVHKLAESGLMTVRHLLPSLEQKIRWPEQANRQIVLIGIRGEVPLSHATPKKPILQAVPHGSAVLGYELWDSLKLKVGDTIDLMGKSFMISSCHGERGTKDDITIWLGLPVSRSCRPRPTVSSSNR